MTFDPPAPPPYPAASSSPYAQPSQFAQPAIDRPVPAGAPLDRNGRNPLGLASLIIGAVGFLLGFVISFVQIGMIRSGGTGGLHLLEFVSTGERVVFGLAAVGLGIIAVLRRGAPKGLGAAGIALGAALLVEVLNNLLYAVLLPLLY